MGTGVEATLSLAQALMGNQGCASRGAGSKTGLVGGYQTTTVQLPDVPPPASQCESVIEQANQPRGGAGGARQRPLQPQTSTSESPAGQKNT